jgi:hypothetical protein
MGKHREPGRPLPKPGRPAGEVFGGMGLQTSLIAVSEMTGIPLDLLCGYVIIAARHLPAGEHELQVACARNDFGAALSLTEHATADLRRMAEEAG